MKQAIRYILILVAFIVPGLTLYGETASSFLIENFKHSLPASRTGVVALSVKEGEQVLHNQLLFGIAVDQLQLELKRAELRYQRALLKLRKKEKELDLEALLFEQKTRLYEAGGISDDAYNIARREYELGKHPVKGVDLAIARNEADEAELNLERLKVELATSTQMAPGEGQITKVYVLDRQWISAGQKILDFLSINPLRVVLQIPLKKIHRFNPDMELKVKVETGKGFVDTKGKVAYIINELDSVDQAGKIILAINNENQVFRPGMRVTVELPK